MGTTLKMNTPAIKKLVGGNTELQRNLDNIFTQYCNKVAKALDQTHRTLYKRGVDLWFKSSGGRIDGKPRNAKFTKEITQRKGFVNIVSIADPVPYKTAGLEKWISRHADETLNETSVPAGASTWPDLDTLKLNYHFNEGFVGLPELFRRPHGTMTSDKPNFHNGKPYWTNIYFKKGKGENLKDYLLNDYYVKQGQKVFNSFLKAK